MMLVAVMKLWREGKTVSNGSLNDWEVIGEPIYDLKRKYEIEIFNRKPNGGSTI
jgi:hypothetical protein